jgi:hypothetical protein
MVCRGAAPTRSKLCSIRPLRLPAIRSLSDNHLRRPLSVVRIQPIIANTQIHPSGPGKTPSWRCAIVSSSQLPASDNVQRSRPLQSPVPLAAFLVRELSERVYEALTLDRWKSGFKEGSCNLHISFFHSPDADGWEFGHHSEPKHI